jgi:hypothetical protein
MTASSTIPPESILGRHWVAKLWISKGEPLPSAFGFPELTPPAMVDVTVAVSVPGSPRPSGRRVVVVAVTVAVAVAVAVGELIVIDVDVDAAAVQKTVTVVVVTGSIVTGSPSAMFHTSAAFWPARPE